MTSYSGVNTTSKEPLSESDDEYDEGLRDVDLLQVDDEYDEDLDDATLLRNNVLVKDKLDECCERSYQPPRVIYLFHSERPPSHNLLHPLRLYQESGSPNLKNLRLACREYTYLPRLLSALFESVRLGLKLERVERQQKTDIAAVKPYFRRVVFDTELPSSLARPSTFKVNPSRLQLEWTEILSQIPTVTIPYVKSFEDALMNTIPGSLCDAQTKVEQLYLNVSTDGDFSWINYFPFENGLKTLIFNPRNRRDYERNPNKHFSPIVMEQILTRCKDSIQHLYFGDTSHMDWQHLSEPVPNYPNLQELYIGNYGVLHFSTLESFLREGCPALKKLTLNGPVMKQDTGTWGQLWHAIRDHPSRMQLEFERIRCGGRLLSFSHFTGGESLQHLQGINNDMWRDARHSLAMYLSRLGEWDMCLKIFNAEPEPASDTEDSEDEVEYRC